LRDRRLLAFVLCVILFHAGNAFILPLAMQRSTVGIGNSSSNMVLAGCLLLSQATVALISPLLGRKADEWGRRPVLLIGFACVPLHAGLLALVVHPYGVIGLQILDGMGAAMFGVLQPLVAADVTRGTNRFNLCVGVLGLAAGIGATLSSFIGGHIATSFGDHVAFLALAGAGLMGFIAVLMLMPETRSERKAASAKGQVAASR
jgi:MFS family permease